MLILFFGSKGGERYLIVHVLIPDHCLSFFTFIHISLKFYQYIPNGYQATCFLIKFLEVIRTNIELWCAQGCLPMDGRQLHDIICFFFFFFFFQKGI